MNGGISTGVPKKTEPQRSTEFYGEVRTEAGMQDGKISSAYEDPRSSCL